MVVDAFPGLVKVGISPKRYSDQGIAMIFLQALPPGTSSPCTTVTWATMIGRRPGIIGSNSGWDVPDAAGELPRNRPFAQWVVGGLLVVRSPNPKHLETCHDAAAYLVEFRSETEELAPHMGLSLAVAEHRKRFQGESSRFMHMYNIYIRYNNIT